MYVVMSDCLLHTGQSQEHAILQVVYVYLHSVPTRSLISVPSQMPMVGIALTLSCMLQTLQSVFCSWQCFLLFVSKVTFSPVFTLIMSWLCKAFSVWVTVWYSDMLCIALVAVGLKFCSKNSRTSFLATQANLATMTLEGILAVETK